MFKKNTHFFGQSVLKNKHISWPKNIHIAWRSKVQYVMKTYPGNLNVTIKCCLNHTISLEK